MILFHTTIRVKMIKWRWEVFTIVECIFASSNGLKVLDINFWHVTLNPPVLLVEKGT